MKDSLRGGNPVSLRRISNEVIKMKGSILYLMSAAALAASACAPAQRVEIYTGGTQTNITLGDANEACLERRVAEECAANQNSDRCLHPVLIRECYEQHITKCGSDLTITTTDYDGDGELEPSEERSEGREYDCVRFVIPASTR
jgi:hypothetical protein